MAGATTGEPRADVAAFDAQGDVGGIWVVDRGPSEIVLREGRLGLRAPNEVLPRDARIAQVGWQADPESGLPLLVLEGANLLLGPRRLSPFRAEPVGDGDTLTVDPRDVGERADAVVGGLLIAAPDALRPLRCLATPADGEVDVTRPGAGQAWFQGGLAAFAAGALPLAALALGQTPGTPGRRAYLAGAVAAAVAGAVALGISRVLAASGSRLAWRDGALTRTEHGFARHVERWDPDLLDGLTVTLDRLRPADRWTLAAAVRVRGEEVPLDRGPQLSVPCRAPLPRLAALEARRLDWVDVARRIARALRRHPDGFVRVHTSPDWPLERARGAVAAGRVSLS